MIRKKIKVAAYARVSTDKDDQLNSLDNQRIYFQNYIKGNHDWEFVDLYWDEGISGTQTKNRVGFNNMIADAINGKIDLIITKEVSRFARNTVDTLSYTRKLKQFDVGVIFILDNIDSRDVDAEFRLTIMASNAQEESRKTSERVKWGQKRQMEKGVVFGRSLLGYIVDNGKISINQEEVPIVKKIFHKYTIEGKGTHVIARELLEEGIEPKRVKKWSNTVILRVLRNEKYVGDLCQKKTITPDYLTHKKKYNRGEEEMVYIKDHHEPIISRELWKATQEELKRRSVSKKQKLKHSSRYWCSGKIKCAECGNRFVGRSRILKNGQKYKTWKCFENVTHGSKKKKLNGEIVGCCNNAINEKSLVVCMNYCISFMQDGKELLKKEILQEIGKIKKEKENKLFGEESIRESIEHYERKKRKSIDLMLDGLISEEDFINQKNWYDEKIKNLKDKLIEESKKDREDKKEYIIQSYRNALDEIMDIDNPSEMVFKEILDHIDVHKNKVLDIWLKSVPFGIRLKIETEGRSTTYKTKILETELIEKSKGVISKTI